MIPTFGLGEVLPPFIAGDVTGALKLPRSPYPASPQEVADVFCTSRERAAILRGWIAFRAFLRAEGILEGFQWIDGSFVENCEAVLGRAPNDIDVVSLIRRPNAATTDPDWGQFVQPRATTMFNSDWTKQQYSCDSYWVDLDADPRLVAELSAYWIGLFSHQRTTFRWKGLVQVDLAPQDEADALQLISRREQTW